MTRIQLRGNQPKAPSKKSALVLPKLGTALNWVPPKAPLLAESREKRRSPVPQ
ncbi:MULTISPECIES: hypothetical protein [Burkholderia]|uniref:Uncharacterized protein n=1 Tax=Burkholderia anthina TaxID=179879 RepID=A0A7T6VH51_9BURK|nr:MULTISPECIES: hypothetical protein [Burkholderia]MBY4866084.1 hypothetical protein [Burkholderia anthina]QQK03861.1 hypothetical protein JFN94_06790 [Burkholderia anthina]